MSDDYADHLERSLIERTRRTSGSRWAAVPAAVLAVLVLVLVAVSVPSDHRRTDACPTAGQGAPCAGGAR